MPRLEHLSEDSLERYALGQLTDEAELAHCEEHLLLCQHCQEKLDEIDRFVSATKSAAKEIELRPNKAKPNLYIPIAIAAAIATIFFIPKGLDRPFAADIVALRNEANAPLPTGRPLQLKLDLTGLSVAKVSWELADTPHSGSFDRSEPNLTLPALPAGKYWLRLYDTNSKELLREFSLVVR